MLTGRVVNFDSTKGFGFIEPDGRGRDVFVHASHLVDVHMLETGQRVSFETAIDERSGRPQATNVRPLNQWSNFRQRDAGEYLGSSRRAVVKNLNALIGATPPKGIQHAVEHRRTEPRKSETGIACVVCEAKRWKF